MKRRIRMRVTGLLLLFLILTAAFVAAFATSAPAALTDPDVLQFASVKISRAAQNIVLRMVLTNGGETGISEFGVALAFWDKNNKRLFAYANTQADYRNEVCYWAYTPDEEIKPGEKYYTEDVFEGYLNAGKVDAAIRYYAKQSGEYVNIPESQWRWFSSTGGWAADNVSREPYSEPDNATYDLADSVNLGYHYYLLDDFNAAYYQFTQGGEWIDEVVIGSLADTAGLLAGDLVTVAGGLKPTENAYAVTYAMAKIAQGESVEWVVERGGSTQTITMALAR